MSHLLSWFSESKNASDSHNLHLNISSQLDVTSLLKQCKVGIINHGLQMQ